MLGYLSIDIICSKKVLKILCGSEPYILIFLNFFKPNVTPSHAYQNMIIQKKFSAVLEFKPLKL